MQDDARLQDQPDPGPEPAAPPAGPQAPDLSPQEMALKMKEMELHELEHQAEVNKRIAELEGLGRTLYHTKQAMEERLKSLPVESPEDTEDDSADIMDLNPQDPRSAVLLDKHIDRKLARERRQYEKRIVEIEQKHKSEIDEQVQRRLHEERVADAQQQFKVFAVKNPDWKKYEQDIAYLVERRNLNLDEAYAQAKRMASLESEARRQERQKSAPEIPPANTNQNLAPPRKPVETMKDAFEAAVKEMKAKGIPVDPSWE